MRWFDFSFMRMLALCLFAFIATTGMAQAKHALTLFTEPKYPPDFEHFDYVNPDAPKGGTVKLHYPLTFDSLNPFILKGLAAPSVALLYDTLMAPALDEPQSYYPLIANDVRQAEDGMSITFTIDSRARFHDGSPITPEDVVFSFNTIKEKGHPVYKLRYQDVKKAEVSDQHNVTFTFARDDNRELPYALAALPVLNKDFYEGKDFAKTSLEIPVASGPYTVKKMRPGRFIVYERVKDYWAEDIPSRKGQFNFGKIRYDVYRDETVALEAFKAGEYDYREEYIARNWALGYDFAGLRDGKVIRDESPHKIPRGMQAFIFNLRKPQFQDRRVREAIGLAFDFEWMNRTLFYGAYQRNTSFFQNTPFAATDMPDEEELALLTPHKEKLPKAVFTKPYQVPVSDGSGFIREHLKEADRLLKEAGWAIRDGVRVHEKTGEPLTIEILARQRSLERLVMAFKRNLDVLGIQAKYRVADDSQYQKRWEQFDFDMTTIWWNMGLTFPGIEQRSFWHCSQVDVRGSQNMAGYCNEVVDMLLDKITKASSLRELKPAARALDRVLLHEHVVIPHFSLSNFRMAYWDKFGIPKTRPDYENGFFTWWIKESAQDADKS